MNKKKIPLSLNFGKIFLTVALLVIFTVGLLFAWWIVARADREARTELLQQAQLVAHAINIERIQALSGTAADLVSPDYRVLKEQLVSTRSTNPQCRFVYLLGRKADDSVFIFMDSEPAGSKDYSPPGQIFGEASAKCRSVFDTGTALVDGPTADRWGIWVSALVPVTNPKTGALLAVMGMDINANAWKWNIASRASLPLALMLVLFIGGASILAAVRRTNASPKPIIRRLLPSMAVIVILLMTGAGTLLWQQYRQNLKDTITADIDDVIGDLKMALDRPFGLVMATQTIAADPSVQKALRERASDRLLAAWQPVFKTMHRQHNLTHFYFFDKNRVCILRVHNPKQIGGRVDRFTIQEANRTGKASTGLELGQLGTLTFRVVQPVFENNELVGYVELGKEIEGVLQTLHIRLGVHLAVVIHKKYLDRQKWEDGMRQSGREANWNRLPDNVVEYASKSNFPAAFFSLIEHANGETGREFSFEGKTWQVSVMPLPDASGQEIGNILIIRDISAEKADFTRLLVMGGAVGGVLLALLLSFIYVLLLRTDQGIRAQQTELLANRRQLRDIIEFLPDATFAIDKEKRVIIWNLAIEKMTGVPAAEMIGRGNYAYTVPFYGEARPQLMDSIFTESDKVATRYLNITREGNTIMAEVFCNALYNNKGAWVFVKASPLYDLQGNITGAIESIHDITDRKQAAEELRALSARQEAILTAVPEIITEVDCNKVYTWVNRAGIEFFGEDVIGKEAALYFDEKQETYSNVQPLFDGVEQIIYVESWQRRKDGEKRLLAWWCRTLKDAQGNITGALSTARDITESKQTEEALRSSQQIIEGIINAIPVRVFWKDRNLVFLGCNTIFAHDAGFADPNDIIGKDDYQMKWRDQADLYRNDDRQIIESGKSKLLIEEPQTTPDGNTITLLTSKLPLRNLSGDICGVLGTYIDITERKNAEATLRESEQKYSSLFSSMLEGFALHEIICDSSGKPVDYRFLDINPAFEKLTGLKKADAIGKTVLTVLPETENIWIESYGKVALTGDPICFENYSSALKRYYQVAAFCPKKNQVAVIFNDITERKLAEAMLQSKTALLEAQVNSTLDGILVVDENQRRMLTNQRIIDLFNVPKHILCDDDDSVFLKYVVSLIKYPNQFLEKVIYLYDHINETSRDEIELKNGMILDRYSAPVLGKDGKYYGRIWTFRDITERKRVETYREMGREVLQILNEPGDLQDSMQRVLAILKTRTGLDAAGIRLKEGDDFPYFTQQGFSGDFLIKENSLIERTADGGVCRDKDGNICLECTCGLVISGKTDPANPLFTPGGSFWTNDSFPILELPPDQDPRLHPRNQCIHHGYASLALVPIRNKDMIVGLMQFNDRRQGCFTLETIEVLEGVALHIGEALMRKQAEDMLRRSEAQLRSYFELPLAGRAITSLAKGWLDVNATLCNMFGYAREELTRMTWAELTHPEDMPRDLAQFNRLLAGEIDGYMLDKRFIHKDGHNVFTLMAVQCLRHPDRSVDYLVVMILDISGLKRAEAELREKEVQYRNLANSGMALIWTAGTDKLCDYFNEPWLKFTGRSIEQETGNGWTEGVHPDDFDRCLTTYVTAFDKREAFEMEYRLRHASGEYRWLLDMGTPNYNSNGEFIGYIGHCFDISERKQAEQELIKAKEKAEESDRLKSAFLANMSHEIRTPMNGILGFAELLKEPKLSSEEQQEYISIIQKSGDRMLNTINDIVSISKIESGQMDIFMSETNVNEQIEYIYTFFKPEVEQKQILLSFKADLSPKEAVIKTDREKVYSILINLVKNAIKFTNTGSIEFGYEKKGEFLEFFVKDTGIGVPKDRLEAIFDRFVQADNRNIRAFQGSGLGLSISKAYVEMLGGKIRVESEEGKGSAFYFTIPYNTELDEKSSAENIISTEKEDNLAKNLKILIAEDDEKSEMLITITIKSLSKEILKARTGIEAVEACRNNPDVDLVLMDIEMPRMDGYEATRQIRQFNQKVIIIAQTAYALAGEKEKAIAAGCNDYIAKPFKKSTLLTLLKKYF